MKAVVCPRLGDPSVLELREWPTRPPGPHEVRIALHGGGVNYTDLMLIAGTYQRTYDPPFVLGTEGAGIVVECGQGVSHVRPGDRVLVQNNVGRGCFADEVTASAARVCQVPDEVPLLTAAGFPINYGTAFYALTTRGRLQAGEVLVVHGASGGVGVAAVQFGKCLGATVIATGGSDAKLAVLTQQGADHVINVEKEVLHERILDLTSGRGADVILDTVGGDVFDDSLRAIAIDGRLLVIGFASGRIPQVACNRILFKGISVVGVPYGGYTERNPEAWAENMRALLAMTARGELVPVIHGCYPLVDASGALQTLASRQVVGKIVLFTEAGAADQVSRRRIR